MSSAETEKKGSQNNDSGHYFLFIYWNPKDKRLFVPKRWGYGWTINFANPLAIVILLVLVVGVDLLLKLL